MREVTLEELKSLARQSYYDLWRAARDLDRDVKLYLHWTAGRYDQVFDHYHVNITGEGRVFVSESNLATKKAATFMRNSGSVAIALCCCYQAHNERDMGYYPPTEKQLNAIAQVVCVLADALDLTIDINRVMTHAEAAHNSDGLQLHEDYGPYSGDPDTRWDLFVVRENDAPWSGGNFVRGAANWWRSQKLLKKE